LKAGDIARLLALGAIWGASFLFVRIVAPVLGPMATADSRMLVAGIALALWFRFTGFDPQWRRWGLHYALAGLINSGVPFVLFAFAALHITAGEMAVLNATSPMWAAVMSAAFLGERLTARRITGLVLGLAGVALIAQPAGAGATFLAVAAAMLASACYGFMGVYLERWAPGAPARGLAVGTQLAAGLLLLPLAAIWPAPLPPSLPSCLWIVGCVLALGLICGALAYVLYFRLIADLGATGALTVTYLIPLFAMLWGVLFLAEPVTLPMACGAALVMIGTLFVLKQDAARTRAARSAP
jgi:drug/metabolite transporter (DMT)-like permease